MLGIKIKCMVVLLNLVLNIPQSLLILLCTTGLEMKKILHRNLRVIPKFSRKFENFSCKSNQPKQNILQVFRQLLTG